MTTSMTANRSNGSSWWDIGFEAGGRSPVGPAGALRPGGASNRVADLGMANGHPHASGLLGRRSECRTLDALIASVHAGQSRALVVRGEAGIGKTALLGYLRDRASGCRIARAAGVESEMELAFAGLHQLCAPLLGHLERLPGPQRDALRVAFG